MTPFQAYQVYLAIKRHFLNRDYDFFKYQGKLRHTKFSQFRERPDKFFFDKIAAHHDPLGLLVSHVVDNPNLWVGSIFEHKHLYPARMKVVDSLRRTFEQELDNLRPVFNDNFLFKPGMIPELVRLFLSGRISLETAVILADVANCLEVWERAQDPLLAEYVLKFRKYLPFMKCLTRGSYQPENFVEIILRKFPNGHLQNLDETINSQTSNEHEGG